MAQRLKFLIKQWSELPEFKDDPALRYSALGSPALSLASVLGFFFYSMYREGYVRSVSKFGNLWGTEMPCFQPWEVWGILEVLFQELGSLGKSYIYISFLRPGKWGKIRYLFFKTGKFGEIMYLIFKTWKVWGTASHFFKTWKVAKKILTVTVKCTVFLR